ncbi:MAG: GHKL domain-containing protein [Deltaproteobacteria bacterium]|nr:GHKL domain-containing protein [Deltaproteobacteria bacterium]
MQITKAMPEHTTPPFFAEIQQQELARLFGRFIWARLLFVPPLFALLAWFVFTDPAPWRWIIACIVGGILTLFFLHEVFRFNKKGLSRFALEFNLAAAVIAHMTIVSVTGGIESPLIYAIIPIAIVINIFITTPTVYFLVALQVIGLWLLAIIAIFELVPDFNPVILGGGARAGHTNIHIWTATLILSLMVTGGMFIGRNARRIFNHMIHNAFAAHKELFCTHNERAKELIALSGEIAHELKNPLASVKGLSSLLADSINDIKGAERLAVLRREVDRMQTILEEFLNFSRPLVPLSLSDVDLLSLCYELATLYEGICQEHGITIEVQGNTINAQCDRRKVKQIIINLLQNAIEASSKGDKITLATTINDGACIHVIDTGHGFGDAHTQFGERLYDPGITTKAQGSGLGLTIARAVARQHGGILTLSTHQNGGCEAKLCLPINPILTSISPSLGEKHETPCVNCR